MYFCGLILNMIFVSNKKHFLLEKYDIPEKPWFFRKPLLGSRNICANCDDRGHIGEHSGKA